MIEKSDRTSTEKNEEGSMGSRRERGVLIVGFEGNFRIG